MKRTFKRRKRKLNKIKLGLNTVYVINRKKYILTETQFSNVNSIEEVTIKFVQAPHKLDKINANIIRHR